MKKSKFKLDGATIQKLLVLHCEKIVLVVVLGIMAWLVYMGYALPGLEADKTPVALAQKSDSTRKFIDEPTRWTNVVSQERFIPMDLADLADESHQNISGLLTEAIREYIQRRRVRPIVRRHLEDSIVENEKLGRLLAR